MPSAPRFRLRHAVPCLLLAAMPGMAAAHGTAGDRLFPTTLTIDDPAVADELTLPQIGRFKEPEEEGGGNRWTTTASGEYSKRITPNFGLSVGEAYLHNTRDSGFDNTELSGKYQAFTSAEHEALVSLGVDWDIGGTGAQRIGAEDFSTLTPTLFFGKGMGDLPDAAAWLKPLAITGVLGYAMPTDRYETDAMSGDRTRHPEVFQWGFTVQYSLPYLQQHVKDVGLGGPFARLVPVVEFAMETPTSGEDAGRTFGTINPGVLWVGQSTQFGVEAVLPVNHASGGGVGAMAQLHFYLDDLFPHTLGRPLWNP